jgi:hypothetical protein
MSVTVFYHTGGVTRFKGCEAGNAIFREQKILQSEKINKNDSYPVFASILFHGPKSLMAGLQKRGEVTRRLI